jgi:hypothetical protein
MCKYRTYSEQNDLGLAVVSAWVASKIEMSNAVNPETQPPLQILLLKIWGFSAGATGATTMRR